MSLEKRNMEEKKIGNNQADEDSVKEFILNIRELYQYLLSKWVIVSVIVVVGAILGFVYAKYSKPVYTATTVFVLEEGGAGGGLGQYAGIASMVGIDIGGSGGGLFAGDNIIELYKSRSMIQKALLSESTYDNKKELLINRYIGFNNLRESWNKDPKIQNVRFTVNMKPDLVQDSLIGEIVKAIRSNYLNVVKPDKKSSIIKVEVRCKDEAFAKGFSDEIVSTVSKFYIETKTKRSIYNIANLQHQTDSVRSVMNGAIYNAASIIDATPNLNPTRLLLRSAPVQKSQFSSESNKAILTELIKNLEIAKISLRQETPLIQLIDEPVLPLEKNHIGKIKGAVFGAFLFGILVTILLIVRKKIRSSLT
ncbi:Lipopolysaccharide biosynthesis protein [Pedobacter cryoconitis]|uniref:Lipopolysaccharide biosynthesis protein n=1 Tax=Pedobacter cryoconitis TaxID=188932 RepID=A0A127VJ67_9SPHI|nr:Wzz/FepE/Etk N-terminal domain-containing protein [Pedobacter cryoconitis]AMQ01374.1 Lipopolysaccharide biosynthesis protein [Pedobacter cryoconitis]